MSFVSFVVLASALLQGPVPVRSIDKGMQSQIDEARQATVRSPDEWAKLWSQHAGERSQPAVDFSREMVVGVFLGSRPTAGFNIEILGAREEGHALVVQYREARPSPTTITAQVLTSPYHLVAVPTRTQVRFEKVN